MGNFILHWNYLLVIFIGKSIFKFIKIWLQPVSTGGMTPDLVWPQTSEYDQLLQSVEVLIPRGHQGLRVGGCRIIDLLPGIQLVTKQKTPHNSKWQHIILIATNSYGSLHLKWHQMWLHTNVHLMFMFVDTILVMQVGYHLWYLMLN